MFHPCLQICSPSWELYCNLNSRKRRQELSYPGLWKEKGGSVETECCSLGGKGQWWCFSLIQQARKRKTTVHCLLNDAISTTVLPGYLARNGQCPECFWEKEKKRVKRSHPFQRTFRKCKGEEVKAPAQATRTLVKSQHCSNSPGIIYLEPSRSRNCYKYPT